MDKCKCTTTNKHHFNNSKNMQQHSLKVSIIKCTDLPKVDLLGSCDAYVQVWVAHSDPNKFKQAQTDNEEGIKQTRVITSLNPEFNEQFQFKFPQVNSGMEKKDPMDKYLVVRVVDKNAILKDEGSFKFIYIGKY